MTGRPLIPLSKDKLEFSPYNQFGWLAPTKKSQLPDANYLWIYQNSAGSQS
jgi:hypothetical protein